MNSNNLVEIRNIIGNILVPLQVSILSTRNVKWTLGGWGGGGSPVTFLGEKSWKISIEIFNILKSSIQNIQNVIIRT